MSLCNEAACQEAIANLLIYLSSAKSFWYTLNTSHEHGFHLANRFGMSHDNYMALLVAADLARYANGMLYIKRTQWELFLRGYYFSDVAFEMEKKKMMLGSSNKRQAFYVIRIGYIGMDSPRKFDDQGLDASPPRLASLGMTQLQFHRSTEDIVLHTKILLFYNSKYDGKDDGNKDDKEEGEEGGEGWGAHNIASAATTTFLASATPNPVTPARMDTNSTTTSINTTPTNTTRNTIICNKYPHLAEYFGSDFDPTNIETNNRIKCLLSEAIDIISAGNGEFKVKNCRNNKIMSYLWIPMASTEKAFHKSKKWLEAALRISSDSQEDDNGEPKSAPWIANHLCRFYKLSFMDALKKNGIPICTKLSAVAFSAIVTAANLLTSQANILSKHLNYHLGKGICPTRRERELLHQGYCMPAIGSLKWDYERSCVSDGNSKSKAECITWEASDISKDMATLLARELQSRNVQDPLHVQSVQVAAGGDHGGPAFQFGASVTVVMLNEQQDFKFEVISCELLCRKESGSLIEATVLPILTKGLKTIQEQRLSISCANNIITCEFGDVGLEVLLFIVGDLAFQAMALGREKMSPHHCMYCEKKTSEMGDLDKDGDALTMEICCNY